MSTATAFHRSLSKVYELSKRGIVKIPIYLTKRSPSYFQEKQRKGEEKTKKLNTFPPGSSYHGPFPPQNQAFQAEESGRKYHKKCLYREKRRAFRAPHIPLPIREYLTHFLHTERGCLSVPIILHLFSDRSHAPNSSSVLLDNRFRFSRSAPAPPALCCLSMSG